MGKSYERGASQQETLMQNQRPPPTFPLLCGKCVGSINKTLLATAALCDRTAVRPVASGG